MPLRRALEFSNDWKSRGNGLCNEGKFYQAIEYYDQALRLVTEEHDALPLLLNRSHARNHSQHYDAGLKDAEAALKISPGNEKGLFRAARALYGLRRYKESQEKVSQMIALYPRNRDAWKDLQRCQARLREESGRYDFGAMLDEAVAKSPASNMDRGSYKGPIEVRQCAIESRGRGLFSTQAILAGDLLLVEKAFSTAFPDQVDGTKASYDPATGLNSSKDMRQLRRELAITTFIKLHRNQSMARAFADLYPGPDIMEEIDEETGHAVVDDTFTQLRIMYNAFAFPILSSKLHWRMTHEPSALANDTNDPSGSIGTWLEASFINHSCHPNVRRSFIGDIMIFRAQIDIPSNTELTFGYICGSEPYAERQAALNNYGFTCTCSICICERDTPPSNFEERENLSAQIIQSFESPVPKGMSHYFSLLSALSRTYTSSPDLEPRRALVLPLINLMTVCHDGHGSSQVLKLGHILLYALGFELDISATTWRISKWGFMCDNVVLALSYLWTAYGNLRPAVVGQVEEAARTAYTIMAGEGVSFEGAYGAHRPETPMWMGGLGLMEEEKVGKGTDLSGVLRMAQETER